MNSLSFPLKLPPEAALILNCVFTTPSRVTIQNGLIFGLRGFVSITLRPQTLNLNALYRSAMQLVQRTGDSLGAWVDIEALGLRTWAKGFHEELHAASTGSKGCIRVL